MGITRCVTILQTMAQFGNQTLRSAMFRERMHLAWLVAGGEAFNGTKEQGEGVRREQELVQEEKAIRRREAVEAGSDSDSEGNWRRGREAVRRFEKKAMRRQEA